MSNSRKTFLKALAGTFTLSWLFNSKAEAKSDIFQEAPTAYLGQIFLFSFNYAPAGWLPCDGRELLISEYSNLYSLIGTTYGGNGSTNFRLPDLRGRVPMGYGSGTGLTATTIGEQQGAETITLTAAQVPSHTHDLNVASGSGTSFEAQGNVPASNRDGILHYAAAANTIAAAGAIGSTGSGAAIDVMQPSLSINFCIAVAGTFPPRP